MTAKLSVWAKLDKISYQPGATISVVVKSDYQIEGMWPCSLTKHLASLSKISPTHSATWLPTLDKSLESHHSMPVQAHSSKGIATCTIKLPKLELMREPRNPLISIYEIIMTSSHCPLLGLQVIDFVISYISCTCNCVLCLPLEIPDTLVPLGNVLCWFLGFHTFLYLYDVSLYLERATLYL